MIKIALILPIYNAAAELPTLLPSIAQQTLQADHFLIIDSSSQDHSQKIIQQYAPQATIHSIAKKDFDHGGTRRLATELIDADIYIFITQDIIFANEHAIQNLVTQLTAQENIACAYGRQLPKTDATPIAAHARLFNYPEQSALRSLENKKEFGIKTCFNSNSFSAYKKIPLQKVGNFPHHLIAGEDVYIAAKLLQQHYQIAYVADALIFHSHNFSLEEEFHRYFSVGVFHGNEEWILQEFASATGEGLRFIQSELKYLLQHQHYHYLPRMFLSTGLKYFAYHLGRFEKFFPLALKKNWGVNSSYWQKQLTR